MVTYHKHSLFSPPIFSSLHCETFFPILSSAFKVLPHTYLLLPIHPRVCSVLMDLQLRFSDAEAVPTQARTHAQLASLLFLLLLLLYYLDLLLLACLSLRQQIITSSCWQTSSPQHIHIHTYGGLCVFLYLPHAEYRNFHFNRKMRTFLGHEDILAGPHNFRGQF